MRSRLSERVASPRKEDHLKQKDTDSRLKTKLKRPARPDIPAARRHQPLKREPAGFR
ncbi:protein of unknown function [Methylocella tundrae]|uniref:Uncharacterized protein n=1 Tax=Methylocella tundrae TaxID=227605 RepID=A0A4U8YY37_METTU|nr:protein of unknown function [Methylocella tundrae]